MKEEPGRENPTMWPLAPEGPFESARLYLPGTNILETTFTCATGERGTMELSGSNVLRYELADGTSVIVRPSGTEPKVKVYILAQGADRADCDEKLARYARWAESLKG